MIKQVSHGHTSLLIVKNWQIYWFWLNVILTSNKSESVSLTCCIHQEGLCTHITLFTHITHITHLLTQSSNKTCFSRSYSHGHTSLLIVKNWQIYGFWLNVFIVGTETFAQKTIRTIKRVHSFLNGLRQYIEPCGSNRQNCKNRNRFIS